MNETATVEPPFCWACKEVPAQKEGSALCASCLQGFRAWRRRETEKLTITVFVKLTQSLASPERTQCLENELIPGFVIVSPQMKALAEVIKRIGRTGKPVLIQGETGTGKELIARALHKFSERKGDPYVTVNAASLKPALAGSELFGHTAGAFTDAKGETTGLFGAAAGGTLFIDEAEMLSLEVQAELLRFLDSGEIRVVGSSEIDHANVRLILATNKKVEDLMKDGLFRKDLFYRFVHTIAVPCLKDRTGEVRYLSEQFVTDLSQGLIQISPDAMWALERYDWPGNVRQLQNTLERAYVLKEGAEAIKPHDLPAEIARYGP